MHLEYVSLLLNNSQSLICELILAPAGEDCVLQLILVHISTETVFFFKNSVSAFTCEQ